jgi:hypothetical protein
MYLHVTMGSTYRHACCFLLLQVATSFEEGGSEACNSRTWITLAHATLRRSLTKLLFKVVRKELSLWTWQAEEIFRAHLYQQTSTYITAITYNMSKIFVQYIKQGQIWVSPHFKCGDKFIPSWEVFESSDMFETPEYGNDIPGLWPGLHIFFVLRLQMLAMAPYLCGGFW